MVVTMTISLENNLLSIDNYKQIFKLEHDLIQVEGLEIQGEKLKVLFLDGYRIVIKGKIRCIQLGEK